MRLNSVGAHIVGLPVMCGSLQHRNPKASASALALDTGAVVTPADFGDFPPAGNRPAGCAAGKCCTGTNSAGEDPIAGVCPLSYTVSGDNGTGVSDGVVSGIAALANG